MATVKVQGVQPLVAKLDRLKRAMKNKILRRATTKACQPIAKTAKAYAPVETGALKKSIGHKVKTYKDSVVGIIGPRAGFGQEVNGKFRDPVKYAHLVERGTATTSPQPFMRTAWAQTMPTVSSIMATEIANGIQMEVR